MLLEIDTRLTKATSNINDDIVTTTKENDKFTNLTHNRMEVEKQIRKEIEKGYYEAHLIEQTISVLPEREKYLMRLRYIQGLKWEVICVKMNYEWTHIHRIHGRILRLLETGN